MPIPILAGLALLGKALAGGAAFAAGSSIVEDAIAEDAPARASPELLGAVFSVLDTCPASDLGMRRLKADLLTYVDTATAPEVLAMRDQALIEAQARCAEAMRTPATTFTAQTTQPPAIIAPPPDGAPAWYWLVFAIITAAIIIGKPGGGKRK